MTDQEYLESQFKQLKNTEYGFKIKISDGEGNSTNHINITSNILNIITKLLKERE